MTARYKLILEYDGSGFVGWQRQDNGTSIQEAVEVAIENFSGEQVRVFGAGRTDAGVHALGQVAHFDLAKVTNSETIANALNAHLRPHSIAVLFVEAVDEYFDARHSARTRVYEYLIVNRRAPLTVERGRAWNVARPLDAETMHEAAQALVGKHDFSTFRARLCQAKSPVKTLDALDVDWSGNEIRVSARARSFLHHQVRNMVGTLELVGAGKWTTDDIFAALVACDRKRGGPTAPADGLYLVEVGY